MNKILQVLNINIGRKKSLSQMIKMSDTAKKDEIKFDGFRQ